MGKSKKKYSLRMRMLQINVSVALVSFLLCGSLFVISVSVLIGKYVNHDLDFLMTEISDNLANRLEYTKSTVYAIRASSVLMQYLQSGATDMEAVQLNEEFMKAVDINHSKNQGNEGEPVVEKVYLFTDDGAYITDFYYALISSEIERSDRIVENVRNVYLKLRGSENGFVTYYYQYGGALYLACPVLDDTMEEQGQVIFEMNLQAMKSILHETDNYQGAFWAVYTENGGIVTASEDFGIKDGAWRDTSHAKPYTGRVDAEDYRLYNRDLGMGLRVSLGIPENHAVRILYDSLKIYIVGIVLILLAGLISFGLFTYQMTKPMDEVTKKLKQVQEGDFGTKLPDYDNKEFHEISATFNQMTKEIDHLINEVYEKQLLVKETELKFLQTQMNPHFMFNVLNAFALQAGMDGNDKLSRGLSTFSQLIQAKIYRKDTEKVRIRQELEYVRYYLEIQNFRYGEQLSYSIVIPDELFDCFIPKLCIQLVVENAVVHGLEPKMEKGSVEIKGHREKGNVVVTVSDDGVGFDMEGEIVLPLKTTADRSHNRVGLNNVNDIIKLMYGAEYGIRIFSRKGQGTRVIIRIPADTGET